MELNEWQIAAIEEGVREADRGQFIDHARLKVKWEKKLAAAVDDLDDIAALGTRELVIRNLPYIIPYRVRENFIEILRVLHTSRRWPGKL